MSDNDDALFKALANPVRREMLDLLKEEPHITNDLAEHFKELSRFAVMQHLGVLEVANLVIVRREGRKRFNVLNPAPLGEMMERWMAPYAERAAAEMLALKKHLEKKENE